MQLDLFIEAPRAKTLTTPPKKSTARLSETLRQHTASIDEALQGIFKSSQEETRLQQARRILGPSIDCLSDKELEICLTEFQHLIDEWLDAFEHELFDGQTLKQVLGQG